MMINQINKKIVVFGLFFIGLSSFCYSEKKQKSSGVTMPDPGVFISEAVYISTNTGVVSVSVLVSTVPNFIHSVNVNTAGTSSKLEIFDSSVSTTALNIRKIANIDTTSSKSLIFDIGLSSGIAIYNQGSIPADITITYFEKWKKYFIFLLFVYFVRIFIQRINFLL